jgi:hypothetical protein
MTEASAKDSKVAGTVAATASAAALACGVCCVLPFALPAALLGTFGSAFAFFESAFPWMRWAAVLSVAAGWLWVLLQSNRNGRRPAKSTLAVMALATVAMLIALMWPIFEGPLVRHFGGAYVIPTQPRSAFVTPRRGF